MATTTVEDLAKELKRTPAALLEQLQAAGINKTSAEDKLTEKDKTIILEHLQVAHGSDAGARPDEAVSWGKIAIDAKPVKVYSDFSLVFPIIIAETFARNFELARRV